MSPKNIRAELPESKSEYVYVRGYYVRPYYRRLPRRRPVFEVDPITKKKVFRLFMSAMLQEDRLQDRPSICELKKKCPSLFQVLGTSAMRPLSNLDRAPSSLASL